MRTAFALAPVALLATACGSKAGDPYARSLAMGSEHVEFTADTTNGKYGEPVSITVPPVKGSK